MKIPASLLFLSLVLGCTPAVSAKPGKPVPAPGALKPRLVTEPVKHDTDDPAIWINRANPAESLVLGTDKNTDGALYVWGLDGKIKADKVVRGLVRPNNVDIAYDVLIGGKKTDIAVVTERYAHRLRAYRLPDLVPVDGGGIPVFVGERARDCMGIALYTRLSDGALFAIVSRSDYQAPTQAYLHQYRLVDDGAGTLRGVFTRAFGEWSGKKEIEAIAVDQQLGFIYYSDEGYGVRKYHADPAHKDAADEVAVFGLDGFAADREGISIYQTGPGTGYILVSNQQNNSFRIYSREGTTANPHDHVLLREVDVSAIESDGSEVTNAALPGFPHGLFVAMSNGKVFHYYAWEDIAGTTLKKAADGVRPVNP
ncbi:MAG: phytase [Verrucomicrobia bacterium]|nr:phytase [Verrucomicrobiota bacterium]